MKSKNTLNRRKFISITSLTSLGVVVSSNLPLSKIPVDKQSTPQNLLSDFANPAQPFRPMFRWWWPHGLVEPKEIKSELAAMADKGFGGAEIADVHHSFTEPTNTIEFGWGTEAWVEALHAALEGALRENVAIDITLGPSWPAALPTVTPNSKASAKELAVGTHVLRAGEHYDGQVPAADLPPHIEGTDQALLLVQLARVEDIKSANEKLEITLDSASVQTLTTENNQVILDRADDDRVIISYWERGSGQRPEGGPHTTPRSYVVDHFSQEGTGSILDYWDKHILTDRIRELLSQVGGALFEDSIEIETDATIWTPGFLNEFERRKGYSLIPYLPLIVQKESDLVFRYKNFDAAFIHNDFWDVLSQLFNENHFAPLQEWAHSLGLLLRAQPYGLKTDATSSQLYIDIPEGESLGFKNTDDYRSLTAVGNILGRPTVSNEVGAFAGKAYATRIRDVLREVNSGFSAGINQNVLHGFSYSYSDGMEWPGFAAFSPYNGYPGYAGSWGPAQPLWELFDLFAKYISRNQYILRQGTSKIDAVFLRQKGYVGSGFGGAWLTNQGINLGWSYEFISPAILEIDQIKVAGSRLCPKGPAYKVLIFEGDAFNKRATTIPRQTARTLLGLARQGLPIIVIGDWSSPREMGHRFSESQKDELEEIITELLDQPTVYNASNRSDVENGLRKLKIKRDVKHQDLPLVHLHRTVDGMDFYFLYNQGDADITAAEVELKKSTRSYVPFIMDAWGGNLVSLRKFSNHGDYIKTIINLKPKSSMIIGIGPDNLDEYFTDDYRYAYQDLTTTRQITIDRWELVVEEWLPGDTPVTTRKETKRLTLDKLTPWNQLNALKNTSGIGTYTSAINLERINASEVIILDFGELNDLVRVKINGAQTATIDPYNPIVDITKLVKPGKNKIEVEVCTTLNNQLRIANPEVFGNNKRQEYGLTRPVSVYVKKV